jgi:hypothetical protein
MTVEDPGQRVCQATWGRDIGLVELGRFLEMYTCQKVVVYRVRKLGTVLNTEASCRR